MVIEFAKGDNQEKVSHILNLLFLWFERDLNPQSTTDGSRKTLECDLEKADDDSEMRIDMWHRINVF